MIRRLPDALKQTLLYGSSIALMKGVSLLMLPFIAHHLSTAEFGRLEVISTLAVIGSVLVGMGLSDTLFRFAGATQKSSERQRLAAEIFSLSLIIGATAWLIGWMSADFIAGWMPGNPSSYEIRLVISVLALEGCIAIPLGWLRMCNRASHFFFATTGRALTQAVLVIILLMNDGGVAGVLEAGLIAAVAQAVVLSYLHIRDTGFSLSRKTGYQSLMYSLPIVGSGLLAFTLNGLDRWILADYAGLDDVAKFGVAAKFSLAVVLLMQPFSMWWSPRRFEVLHGSDGIKQVAHFASLGVMLTLTITLLVGLASPLLINWLLPETYATASQYVIGLVLVMALREMVELFNLGCFIGNTTSTQLLINAVSATAGISCMFWLTPAYAVWGIIFSLLLAQALRLLLFIIASQHYLPLPYPARSLLLMTSISIGWLLLGYQTSIIWQQLLIIMLGIGSLLAAAFMFKIISVPQLTVKQLPREQEQ